MLRYRDISKKYYEQLGMPMLKEQFPELSGRYAVGLVGRGSECFGYDDSTSLDHDIEPGFCIWLLDEDYADCGEVLQESYDRLPKSFMGISLQRNSISNDKRKGVFSISEFYTELIGYADVPDDPIIWMSIPQYAFAEATNGIIFYDGPGECSRIRTGLLRYYPDDVLYAKLSKCLISMAQSGQYNFERCLRHGEMGAAVLALDSFVRESIRAAFLLNRRYCPYYKWSLRALSEIEGMNLLVQSLNYLLIGTNEDRGLVQKMRAIERVCAYFIDQLRHRGLSDSRSDYLEQHAYEVKKLIQDQRIKSYHIFE